MVSWAVVHCALSRRCKRDMTCLVARSFNLALIALSRSGPRSIREIQWLPVANWATLLEICGSASIAEIWDKHKWSQISRYLGRGFSSNAANTESEVARAGARFFINVDRNCFWAAQRLDYNSRCKACGDLSQKFILGNCHVGIARYSLDYWCASSWGLLGLNPCLRYELLSLPPGCP